ncbi:MAG: tRNA epoxyqueuosine(34) reductase QueG [Alphaproteobacteria bacterium]|jgi:epoxyqueuosine reductase
MAKSGKKSSAPPMTGAITKAIHHRALALGFDAVGFSAVKDAADGSADLAAFIKQGHHGDTDGNMDWDMDWMEKRVTARARPGNLWPDARSVISLGLNYGQGEDPMINLARPGRGTIASYARGRDYHLVVKSRLKQLGRWIAETYDSDIKVFVDTAPVMEKPLAQRAGIGWQGKHTNMVSREFGSWLFLGEIFTTLDLTPDAPESDHCGNCQACLDICPTDAFPEPGKLDSKRCISYLTIEHKGTIAPEFRIPMGNRIYGCDDCLAICPWNKYASQTSEPTFLPRIELTAPKLADLVLLDDQGFRDVFSTSPIKRIGRDRFIRNVLIAIGNSGDSGLAPVVRDRLKDDAPIVRAMAVWALSRLVPPDEFSALSAQTMRDEKDLDVIEEWNMALQSELKHSHET